MPCDLVWSFPEVTLSARSVDQRFLGLTGLFPVGSGTSVSGSVVTNDVDAQFRVALGVEYYAVRASNPGTPATVGAAISTATTTGRLEALSCDAQLLARLGLIYYLNSGATEQWGRVTVASLAVHQCVELLRPFTLVVPPVLQASANLADAWVQPVTPFVVSAGNVKAKLAVMARDLVNATDTRGIMVYRTANNIAQPGSWQLLESSSWHTPSGSNDEWNASVQTPTLTDEAFVQFGFAVRRNTAGGAIGGDFEIVPLLVR